MENNVMNTFLLKVHSHRHWVDVGRGGRKIGFKPDHYKHSHIFGLRAEAEWEQNVLYNKWVQHLNFCIGQGPSQVVSTKENHWYSVKPQPKSWCNSHIMSLLDLCDVLSLRVNGNNCDVISNPRQQHHFSWVHHDVNSRWWRMTHCLHSIMYSST